MSEQSGAAEVLPAEGESLESNTAPESTADSREVGEIKEQPDATEETREQPEEEKKFTQAELEEKLQKRLARQSRKEQRTIGQLQAKLEMIEKNMSALRDGGGGEEDAEPERELSPAELKEHIKQELLNEQKQEQFEKRKLEIFTKAQIEDPDFDLEDFAEVTISDVMVETIMESDIAEKLVTYFNSNPDEADRIADLSNARQAAELGKLEVKLTTEKPKAEKSGAPAPVKPVKGSTKTSKSLSDMTQEEYNEAMRAFEKTKR